MVCSVVCGTACSVMCGTVCSVVCSMSSLSWAVHHVWGRRWRYVQCYVSVCCVMGVLGCSVASKCVLQCCVDVCFYRRLCVFSSVCYL